MQNRVSCRTEWAKMLRKCEENVYHISCTLIFRLLIAKLVQVDGRNLDGMNTLMHSESAFCFTPIVAFVAGVWALSRMYTLVYREGTGLCASILAFIADEWALIRVNSLVCSEI